MTDVILPGPLSLDLIDKIEAEQPTPKGAYKAEWNSFATSGEPFRIVTNKVFKGKTGNAMKASFSRYLEPHLKAGHWPEMSILVAKGSVLRDENLDAEAEYAVLVNEDIRAQMAAAKKAEAEASDEDEN